MSASSYAQQGSTVISACEQAVDELKVKRVEVTGLQEQIRLRDEQSKLTQTLIANLTEQAAFWKDAATARKDALSMDTRIETIRLQQINEYKDEIARLRAENEALRRSRDKRFIIGSLIGVGVGKFLKF